MLEYCSCCHSWFINFITSAVLHGFSIYLAQIITNVRGCFACNDFDHAWDIQNIGFQTNIILNRLALIWPNYMVWARVFLAIGDIVQVCKIFQVNLKSGRKLPDAKHKTKWLYYASTTRPQRHYIFGHLSTCLSILAGQLARQPSIPGFVFYLQIAWIKWLQSWHDGVSWPTGAS